MKVANVAYCLAKDRAGIRIFDLEVETLAPGKNILNSGVANLLLKRERERERKIITNIGTNFLVTYVQLVVHLFTKNATAPAFD